MRFFLFSLFFLCMGGLFAQVDIESIKTNPDYYWAEGKGVYEDEATDEAMRMLLQKISGTYQVYTNQVVEQTVDGDEVQSQETFRAGMHSASSLVSLQGIESMLLSREPDAVVFVYISKKAVEEAQDLQHQKIADYVEAGQRAEKKLQIDDALRNYYWALMLAKSQNAMVEVELGGETINCLTDLPAKINSVVLHVKVALVECVQDQNRFFAKMRFTYGGQPVNSLQVRYFDGQSWSGSVAVKDGYGVLELLKMPASEKIEMQYEYRFKTQAERLDPELKVAFASGKNVPINSAVSVPVKVNVKAQAVEPVKKYRAGVSVESTGDMTIMPPDIEPVKTRIVLDSVVDNSVYLSILRKVELAIQNGNPESVYSYFTAEGYDLFKTMLEKTGKVSLVNDKMHYELVKAEGQVLARYCDVRIKFRNGKSFMEKIVFRFDPETCKIQSLAFALTSRAEDDIFNAAASWPEVSRFAILQFMEDYQTAYALKRLDYIDKIFSEDALIIVGTVLQPRSDATVMDGIQIDFDDNPDVRYDLRTKQEYMKRLRRVFSTQEYVHLTFEDNLTKSVGVEGLPVGTAFVIQISQMYDSPAYSDKGYLTLMLDASQELPIIHVRLWTPDKKDMMTIDEFVSKWAF